MEYDSLYRQLLERLPDLSMELRRAARFLIDHPDEVPLASMRVIAAKAGVTPTTFVRLARRLGFSDWASFRRPFEDRLRKPSASLATRADALVKHPSAAELFRRTVAAARDNLDLRAGAIEDERIALACDLLHGADFIHVAGFRSCRAPAISFVYLSRLFRRKVTLLGADGGTLETDLAAIGPKDAVLCIGFSPYSRELKPVVDIAIRRGAPIVALVDSEAAPPARAANVSLMFSAESPSFFPSVAGAVGIVEALAAALLSRAGPKAAAEVRAVEEELRALGAYQPE